VCIGGVCGGQCDSGWGDCDYALSNGCESYILDDPDNCGGCGSYCVSRDCRKGICWMP
jgi:hypothetical protein